MREEDLEKLIELSKEGHKCPNVNCCEYGKYNECYNHSHVFCQNFEEYYQHKDMRERRSID